MKIVRGNIFRGITTDSIVLFSGNCVLDSNDSLVMGSGVAAQFKHTFKGIEKDLGNQVVTSGTNYGVVIGSELYIDPMGKPIRVGAFQSKRHWSDPSDADILAYSVNVLKELAEETNSLFHMNMPAIGLGGMSYNEVMEILYPLPDNVFVYFLSPSKR